jgi:glucosylglycerate synthase
MAELDNIPQPARQHLERIGAADLVIGLLAGSTDGEIGAAVACVREALAKVSSSVRTVVTYSDPAMEQTAAEWGPVEEDANLHLFSYPPVAPATPALTAQSTESAYRAVFAAGEKLGARAYGVIASNLDTLTSTWIYRLIQPVLQLDFDLVTPCYADRTFEGLLNSSIICPLTRALYGKRIRHPMGPDFGFSGRLVHRFLGTASGARAASRVHPLTWFATEAICGGFQVCQAHVGIRVHPPTDWVNLSSVLAQVLDPLFLDVQQNAAFWQRTRGSQPVPAFGESVSVPEAVGAVDVRHLIESFQLGCRSLQEVWGIVLPPKTVLELTRLARLPADRFRMPDEFWVRIIYDFALGHRLRTISRDHLLRAMTPLYLAWVASYALELETAGAAAVAQRLEQLSVAYETAKPYFLSRWRWPDRFNP